MNEKEFLKKMLVSVGIAIVKAEKLMESENKDVKMFALDAFIKLTEIEMTLMTALGVKSQSDERNSLARRTRLGR